MTPLWWDASSRCFCQKVVTTKLLKFALVFPKSSSFKSFFARSTQAFAYLWSKGGFLKKNEAKFCCHIFIVQSRAKIFCKELVVGDLLLVGQTFLEPCFCILRTCQTCHINLFFSEKNANSNVLEIVGFCSVRVYSILNLILIRKLIEFMLAFFNAKW